MQRGPPWNRYYSGVRTWQTTTSCGRGSLASFACTLLLVLVGLTAPVAGQADRAQFDPPLIPAEIVWSASLDSPLVHPPVSAGDMLIVALRSGTLGGLALGRGTSVWSVEQAASVALAADELQVYAAHGSTIAARTASSGALAWSRTLDAPVASPLAARGGWVLALDSNGMLVALRAADGEVVWRRAIEGEGHDHAPTIEGETVVVTRRSGEVVALSIREGTPSWTVRLDGSPGVPLLVDGRVIIGASDNALYCLDEDTGRLIWRWRSGGDIKAAPVVDATHIYYVSLDNMLRAIDRRSGNLRWKRSLSARATSGLRLVSDQLLVSGLAPVVRAHRVADGRPAGTLEVKTDLLAAPPLLVPRLAPDYVFLIAAGRDGSVFAYRPTLSLPTTPLEGLPGLPAEWTPPDSLIEASSEPR